MPRSERKATTLRQWKSIAARLRRAVGGLTRRQLDARGGSEGWSIREYAHHLVEANLVASTIVVAAIGKPGCSYDWSWLIPDQAWMHALGYRDAPLAASLDLLDALASHVGNLITPRNIRNTIVLAGSRRTRETVESALAGEVAHAKHHLADIAVVKRTFSRTRKNR